MHAVYIMAARSNPLGLGAGESIVILVVLLVLFSGYALGHKRRVHAHDGRLTRGEIYFASTLGVILAVAVAIIAWRTLAR